jgi:hypothetical protein
MLTPKTMFAAAARPIFSSFARTSARRFAWVNPKQASTAAVDASQSGGGGAGLAIALGLLGFAGGGALAYYQFSDGTLRLVAPIAEGSKNIAADFEAKLAPNGPFAGVLDMVGHTPLIELKSLSAATGCRIFAKAEHMNPGHSVKDRAARQMVLEAEKDGRLKPGGTIVEATGGMLDLLFVLHVVFCRVSNLPPNSIHIASFPILLRQYWSRPCHGGGRQGLQGHLYHARLRHQGEAELDASVWRRGSAGAAMSVWYDSTCVLTISVP